MKMLAIAALLMVASTAQADGPQGTATIVGGSEVTPRQYPFQVSLQIGNFHFCGGVLVAPGWVLTAAHCLDPEVVEVGVHKLSDTDPLVERIGVKNVFRHPNYNKDTLENDVSLLQLQSDSTFEPIEIYFNQYASDLEADGKMTTVSGWGSLISGGSFPDAFPDALQAVDVPLVSNQVCRQSYGNKVKDSMICAGFSAGGKDACQGDSGGPLFVEEGGKHVVVGVVSWGVGCAFPDFYGVYSRVSSFSEFLCSTANLACKTQCNSWSDCIEDDGRCDTCDGCLWEEHLACYPWSRDACDNVPAPGYLWCGEGGREQYCDISGYCHKTKKDVCEPSGCQSDDQCQDKCVGGVCLNEQLLGEQCCEDAHCASNSCNADGKCACETTDDCREDASFADCQTYGCDGGCLFPSNGDCYPVTEEYCNFFGFVGAMWCGQSGLNMECSADKHCVYTDKP